MKRIHSVAWVRYAATIVIKSPLHKTGKAVIIMSISQIGKPRLGEAEQAAYQ